MRVFLSMLMTMALAGGMMCGCRHVGGHDGMDLRLRGSVDHHNKAAFVNRYQSPRRAREEAEKALMLVRDSLPDYRDEHVFAGQAQETIAPTAEEVAGFERYLDNYQQYLSAEKAIETC